MHQASVRTLVAHPLEHLRVGGVLGADLDRPRSCVRARIRERGLDLQRPEARAAVAFSQTQLLRVGMAVPIEPGSGVEAVALDDERIALPAAHGVSHP